MITAGLTLALPACKKKAAVGSRVAQESSSAGQPLALGFAVKNAIIIQAAPDVKSKALTTLSIGSAVEIFASKVADQKLPDTVFWYKVKYSSPGAATPVEGFISEREEVMRENFLVFTKKNEEKVWVEGADGKSVEKTGVPGVMATTTLNLRKSPALNGGVIRQLKNGEVLKVLEVSNAAVEVDKKRAEWFLVSDAQGVTGYCFGGFLLTGLYDELSQLQDVGFRFIHGWARVTGNKVKALRSPVGADTFDLSTLPGSASDKPTAELAKGTLVQIDGETTKSPEPRYRVLVRFEAEPEYYEQKYFYIPKASAQFTGDYFTISNKLPHKIDAELAKDLNRYLKGDVNLQCTTVLPFEGGGDDEKRSFFAIKTATGHTSQISNDNGKLYCAGVNSRISLLVEKKDDRHIVMGKMGGGELNFIDMDGDGIPEVVSENYHGRGGRTLEVNRIVSGRLVSLLHNDSEPGSCVNAVIKGKYLILEGPEPEAPVELDNDYCKDSLKYLMQGNKSIALGVPIKQLPAYFRFDGAKFQKIEKPEDLAANPG